MGKIVRNEKILVVDDDADILHFIRKMLKIEGFKIRTAANAGDALDWFRSEPFDLVITDIRMPEISGLKLIKEIRYADEETEIIVLTGFPSIDIAVRTFKDYRIYDFFTKPIENEHFLVAVENALERRRLCRERNEYNAELRITNRNLEQANEAMKLLLKVREEDKAGIENKVLFNTERVIMPYLEKLKKSLSNDKQKNLLRIIESNLKEITSPPMGSLSPGYFQFTPSEIRIANLVKQGKTAKEIADLLNLSVRTVETHKCNVRNKIGLKNKKINLRTYLMGMREI
ncbi:response regulator [Desulfococcaceae bacterium HSG8]|nr:response regulator [Desulfococcaceae bacterium HSG8]